VFGQHCESGESALTGDFRYNADVSIAATAPLTRHVQRHGNLSFLVYATKPGAEPLALAISSQTPLPGAMLVYDEYRSAMFSWTPATDQVGDHLVTFIATDGLGGVDSSSTIIHV